MDETNHERDMQYLSQFTIEELMEEVGSREEAATINIVSEDMVDFEELDDPPLTMNSLLELFVEGAVVYLPNEDIVLCIRDKRNL